MNKSLIRKMRCNSAKRRAKSHQVSKCEFRQAAARFSVCQGSRPYSEGDKTTPAVEKRTLFLYILRFYITWK